MNRIVRLLNFLNEMWPFGNSKSLHHKATNVEHIIPIPICRGSYFPESTSHGRNNRINALVNFIDITKPDYYSIIYCAGKLRVKTFHFKNFTKCYLPIQKVLNIESSKFSVVVLPTISPIAFVDILKSTETRSSSVPDWS